MALGLLAAPVRAPSEAQDSTDIWPDHAISDEEAGAAARTRLPFTRQQIELLGRLLQETQQATAEARETAAREERDRVSKVEAENRELREAVATLTDWLALAVLGSRAEDDGTVDATARRIAKSVSERTAAGRTLNATEEQGFVKGLLPRGSGNRIARRAAGRL